MNNNTVKVVKGEGIVPRVVISLASETVQKLQGSREFVRYLQPVKLFNGLQDIKAGEVVRVTKILGASAAWVERDNGDTWAEIGIDGERAVWHQVIRLSVAQALVCCKRRPLPHEVAQAEADKIRLTKLEQFVQDHPYTTWEEMAFQMNTTPAAVVRAFDRLEKKMKGAH
jgi:hypothetical protein